MHSEPTLEDLGYQSDLEQFRISNNLQEFDPARVIAEHKERYIVKNNTGEYSSEKTNECFDSDISLNLTIDFFCYGEKFVRLFLGIIFCNLVFDLPTTGHNKYQKDKYQKQIGHK